MTLGTASGKRIRDDAFMEINRAGIEIGRRCSVGYGRELDIVASLEFRSRRKRRRNW